MSLMLTLYALLTINLAIHIGTTGQHDDPENEELFFWLNLSSFALAVIIAVVIIALSLLAK